MQGWTQTLARRHWPRWVQEGPAAKSLTEGACATSCSISAEFCSFVVVQGDNGALASTPLWINTKSSMSDAENIGWG